ncbi:MAG TPA: hypothetical protein VFY97_06320 [Rhodanobacteraceae bacterium]|nr:hypothetical protein [Rhodanobacteraceae bacterium]
MNVSKVGMRLRTYDWTAAFIELVIVVVGILIALEVNNWNQDRQDQARADGYYRRIHADLSTDGKSFGTTLAYWGRVSAYGRGAIAYGESGQLVDGSAWKTVLAYYQASQTLPFVPSDASFTEMRSAGELGLIADERLRGRLEDYYSMSGIGGESIIRQQDPAYRKQVRGLTPWSVQQYIWDRCYRERSYADQGFVVCPSPISEPEALAILSTFKAAPSLLDNLRTWMSTLRISQIVLDNNRREAQRLAAEVERARRH